MKHWILQGWTLQSMAVTALLAGSMVSGFMFAWGASNAGENRGKDQEPVGRENWRIAEPITYEGLSVFPVLARETVDTSPFITLDEGLASGEAIVTEQGSEILRRSRGEDPGSRPIPEQGGGAQVNQLVLVNRSSRPLLLLAGEVVSGGKQDRIIGKDRIVPAGAEPLPLDVFCVEHGRWASSYSNFSSAKMMVHPSVREKAAVAQNQSEVWAAVRNGTTAETPRGASSGSGDGSNAGNAGPVPTPELSRDVLGSVTQSVAPTGSYVKMYGSKRVSGSVENFATEVERRFKKASTNWKGEHVIGVVVAYGGEVAWSDVFASSQLFDRYWPKLLRSYVVEALARPGTKEQASTDDARDFLRQAKGHERAESEPGVYRWIERSENRETEIELIALAPKTLTLHWMKVLRTS